MPGRVSGMLLAAVSVALGACATGHAASEPPGDEGALSALPDNSVKDTTAWRGAMPVRAEELLEGRFAGVQVMRLANGGYSVRIRGTSTILGNAEPLYVIDGLEVSPSAGGGLIGINPSDIATIQVLRDAGSTAIYGVRGSNGVIVITTKRGP